MSTSSAFDSNKEVASKPQDGASHAVSAKRKREDSPTSEAKQMRLLFPDDENDDDFSLVSSDNVIFRVPSYHLFAASVGFRDLSKAATSANRVIELTDDTIETAAVVDCFLKLARNRSLKITDAPQLANLTQFLMKWQCAALLENLCCLVRDWLQQGVVFPLDAFLVAAIADDTRTAYRALRSTWTWEQKKKNLLERHTAALVAEEAGERPKLDLLSLGTLDKGCWDPAHWSKPMWALMPVDYAVALARAHGATNGDHKALRNQFPDLLKMAKKTQMPNGL